MTLSCSKGHLIALDIIRGLVFLHSNKVVHADLKAKNVLLTQNAGELVALNPFGSGNLRVQLVHVFLMHMRQTQAVDCLVSLLVQSSHSLACQKSFLS